MKKRNYVIWILLIGLSAFGGISLGKFNKARRDNVLGTAVPAGSALEEVPIDLDAAFGKLKEDIKDVGGRYGLYIEDLYGGKVYEYNPAATFYGASLYKVLVAASVFNKLDVRDIFEDYLYAYEERHYDDGTGSIASYPIGSTFTIRALLEALLKESDNTAQNILVEIIGEDAIIQTFEKIMGNPSNFVFNNTTSPREFSTLVNSLYKRSYLQPGSREKLFTLMSETAFDDRISVGLDAGLTFSHKIGSWGLRNSWHDCGLVRDGRKAVVVCLMSENTNFDDFLSVAKKTGRFISLVFEE